jgi:hypothetical protein
MVAISQLMKVTQGCAATRYAGTWIHPGPIKGHPFGIEYGLAVPAYLLHISICPEFAGFVSFQSQT